MYKSENNYLVQLDGIRAIAVTCVMLSHFIPYHLIRFVPFGSMGVNLFFVLSGFLITRILIKTKIDNEFKKNKLSYYLVQFYFRRTLRIFPIYYLTIFLLFIIHVIPDKAHLFWLLSYLMNIKFSMPTIWESSYFGHFIHFWSLCVEEQFYLFFPISVFLISIKKLKYVFLLFIIVGISSRLLLYILNAPINSLYVLTPTCFDSFGIGALLAYMFIFQKDKLENILRNRIIILIFVIVFILSLIISRNFLENYKECRTVLERFLFSLCCFYFVGIAALGSYSGKTKLFLQNSKIIYVGKISYGLYIYHNFVPYINTSIAEKFNFKPLIYMNSNIILSLILNIIITFLIASFSWRFIENPINKLKNKY